MSLFPVTYGELIQGLNARRPTARPAVFNEHQVRAAAGLTLALGAVAFVYAYFAKVSTCRSRPSRRCSSSSSWSASASASSTARSA